MTNGTTNGVTLDELLQGVARDRDRGAQTPSIVKAVSKKPPTRRRRGPDAKERLSADRLHQQAVAVLYGLRGLTRAEQARVLAKAATLLER